MEIRSRLKSAFKRTNKKPVNKGFIGGFSTQFLGNNTPVWINSQNVKDYERIICTNPVAYSTIDILSRYFANGRIKLKNLKTGKIITQDNISGSDNNAIVNKAFDLFNNPNVLQSRWEYLRMQLFLKKTFGNSFNYAFVPNSHKTNIENVLAMWNVWPQYMNVVLTGKYFSATKINEIIKIWKFGYLGTKGTEFAPEQILHRKEINPNLTRTEDLIFGDSPLKTLNKPLSNIEAGYESENVILKNRGVRIAISPDASGQDEYTKGESFTDDEKKELEEAYSEYGTLKGQKQTLVTRLPHRITVIDQDIRKLGIFESIANNALVCANTLGVPIELVKLYIQGATFENQKQAEIRMYNSTIIPEFDDYVEDVNGFLKMREFGYQYMSSFEHIAVLQEDKKLNATANSLISNQYEKKFKSGACTYNEWRRATGDQEETWGGKRIFELSSEEIAIILNKPVSNGQQGQETEANTGDGGEAQS